MTTFQSIGRVVYSMSVSIDGFINDRFGDFGWTPPSDELFRFHLSQVRELDSYLLGRRLYETMRVWETDPSLRSDADRDAFADVWAALPKVVFSRTLADVEGNARLATGTLEEELERTSGNIAIGGATLAAAAIEQDLVDDLRIFRHPVIVGGGTAHLPALDQPARLELAETRTFDVPVVYERYRRPS
jgi:dihydrofolate reductase